MCVMLCFRALRLRLPTTGSWTASGITFMCGGNVTIFSTLNAVTIQKNDTKHGEQMVCLNNKKKPLQLVST